MVISVIIPIFNEEENIENLYGKITESLASEEFSYEIIFINDGSQDFSGQKLKDISRTDSRVKVIEFRRNYGQTAAMMAGFDFASGEIIIPMDGDLQNDPKDIPRLVAEIQKGSDICSGWRKNRRDTFLTRKLPSWIANKLISRVSGVNLHDYGCTLKAYRSEIIKKVRLYGEMHRFIPIYASWHGAKITEIPVTHHPREHGKSNYGAERILKVLLDLLVVIFYLPLSNKPIYIFGGFGFLNISFAFVTFFLMIYYKFWGNKSFVETPLPLLVIFFFTVGAISILMGFMAEIMMRIYYESQNKATYLVKHTHNLGGEEQCAESRDSQAGEVCQM